MAKIVRTIPIRHDKAQLLGGLLHYTQAASNHTGKAYRRGVRGKDLYRMAVHRTGVYQSRFADYIIRDVFGSHKSWRTHQLTEPHARAPHYHNPVAQTDIFEAAFDDTAKRWNGKPAIYVAIYGRGRPNQPWMPFGVPTYVVEKLSRPGVKPKTVRIGRDHIWISYEEYIPDREPAMWAGVDKNVNNDTYAFADGTIVRRDNDLAKLYNRVFGKIYKIRRRGDNKISKKLTRKAWEKYTNRVKDHIRKEARWAADNGIAVGHEDLTTHKLYTKDSNMAPFMRGKLKSGMNAGRRRGAMVCAAESEGLPHAGVDPHGTSAKCLECGGKLKRSVSYAREARSLWCQPCKAIRERDCNAPANILFRTVLGLVVAATGWDTKESGISERKMTRPAILSVLGEAVRCPMSGRDHQTLTDIMRLLEGRSAGADWRLPGAHKPGRQSPAGGEPAGGPGVDGAGWNTPGPPNAAKLCEYA